VDTIIRKDWKGCRWSCNRLRIETVNVKSGNSGSYCGISAQLVHIHGQCIQIFLIRQGLEEEKLVMRPSRGHKRLSGEVKKLIRLSLGSLSIDRRYCLRLRSAPSRRHPSLARAPTEGLQVSTCISELCDLSRPTKYKVTGS
jgi:hypothetical protein